MLSLRRWRDVRAGEAAIGDDAGDAAAATSAREPLRDLAFPRSDRHQVAERRLDADHAFSMSARWMLVHRVSRGRRVTWAKLDDGFPDHPKIVSRSLAAKWLFVESICYANKFETDGRVPKAASFVKSSKRQVIDELIAAGLWEPAPDEHYLIHDFLDYNPSHDELNSKRDSKRMAGAKGAASRWHGGGNAPDPTRPDPSRDPVPSDPPNPPQAGGTRVARAERAKNGSGRRRDVIALHETETPEEAIERHRAKLFAHSGRTA